MYFFADRHLSTSELRLTIHSQLSDETQFIALATRADATCLFLFSHDRKNMRQPGEHFLI